MEDSLEDDGVGQERVIIVASWVVAGGGSSMAEMLAKRAVLLQIHGRGIVNGKEEAEGANWELCHSVVFCLSGPSPN